MCLVKHLKCTDLTFINGLKSCRIARYWVLSLNKNLVLVLKKSKLSF